MKVNLYIMGQYRGVTEIGDDSLCGCLIRRDFGGAAKKSAALQRDIDRIIKRNRRHPAKPRKP